MNSRIWKEKYLYLNIIRKIIYFTILLIINSCSLNKDLSHKRFIVKKDVNLLESCKLFDNLENIQCKTPKICKIKKLIRELVSPIFFEYTQAARELIKIGAPAIKYLYRARKCLRESDSSVIPVTLLIIKIIIQQQKLKWLKKMLKTPYPEIKEIIKKEIKRRKKNKKNKKK